MNDRIMKKLAWTRSQLIDEIDEALGSAALFWFEARLAAKNGKKVWALRWKSEFEREVVRKMIHVADHPVKKNFDRTKAFKEAVAEMKRGTIRRLREHVERQFAKRVRVRRGLDDADVREFWSRARALAGATLSA